MQPIKIFISSVQSEFAAERRLLADYLQFEDGTSPTEREFDCASVNQKYRLVFLLNIPAKERHPKMNSLVKKVSGKLVYGKFSSPAELLSDVYSSLVNYLVKN